ncbi:MAG: T9SS type A sorting domain-containing protein [Bacteroidetes bacterium]|nr:T9SS type A sorting domain-containing protein [Bacteroidota bacterium]
MNLRSTFLLLFTTLVTLLQAQQNLWPLNSNPVLKNYNALHPSIDQSFGIKHFLGKTNTTFDSLPFFEDFTSSTIIPDTNKWLDRNVFINNGFPQNPPSFNVATFDGLDKEGNAYKIASGIGYGQADTLTSAPLNFASYSAANNIYFSFFYEMAGYGDIPLPEDSLLLQFLSSGGKWNTIWIKAGGKRETVFTQVILPVSNALYFHGAFQFRFINYASLSGNLNHWNLDYIRIDRNRNMTDSFNTDVAIMTSPTPILKRYYSMPWDQYKASSSNENAASTSFYVRNLKNTNVQVPSKYFVFNKASNNLLSNTTFTLGSLTYQAPQKITYNFTTLIDTILPIRDSVRVKSLYTASENSDVRRTNDSIYKDQLFANYFAYDDGGAEAGYGIDFGSGKVALGYETNMDDTLRAIDIYFNQSLTTNSGINFTLMAWNTIAIAGQQEKILHFQTVMVPEHSYTYRDKMGGFTRYQLDTPRFLPKGKFYIGWRQNSTYMLNVGFDMNYPDNFGVAFNPNMYYNTNGTWQVSGFPGTVMMRPVTGKQVSIITGLQDLPTNPPKTLSVYPNPAHALLYIDLPENENQRISIMDMQGKMVKQMPMQSNVINVQDLTKGIYFLNIFDPSKNQSYKTKFIIY